MKKPTSLMATLMVRMVTATMSMATATTTMMYTEHGKFQLGEEEVKHNDEIHSNTATMAQTTRD